MACCPTTSLNVWGLYLRADTIKGSKIDTDLTCYKYKNSGAFERTFKTEIILSYQQLEYICGKQATLSLPICIGRGKSGHHSAV